MTSTDGLLTGGIIAETEAYAGVSDRASHAFGGRYTARTSIMYQMGGVAYVYLCYGMHQMFNVVSGPKGVPHAILIRGIVPLIGIETIQQLMGGLYSYKPLLINGPGKVCKALRIERDFNGLSLDGPIVWITEKLTETDGIEILSTKRVGVDYAG
jgi:DNA-3-methyladenine glycosylase